MPVKARTQTPIFGIESADSRIESAVSSSRIGRFYHRFVLNNHPYLLPIHQKENRGEKKCSSGYGI